MTNAVSISGNLTADPQLKFSQSGDPRAFFTVAVNTGSEEKGNKKAHFVPVTVFGTLAENVAESIEKGTRVVVTGRFDSYNKDVEMDGKEVDKNFLTVIGTTVSPDLTFASAEITKNPYGDADDEEPKAKPKAKKSTKSKPKAKSEPEEDPDDDF
ncbi:single-stranded DNA-binding protein [Aeromicrobium sp. CTD01-1L150]|uniref:single-stranded DNA-binding protein n=1 Tax=Aeromicrobium sp. CTD01-1L150 TaxID=3341830 RepID=UPI0035C1581B